MIGKKAFHVQRDIDYTDGSSGVVGPLKSKASYRDIPIEDELHDLLYERRGSLRQFLFKAKNDGHISLATFLRRWMRLMIDCGFAAPVTRTEEGKKTEAGTKKRKPDLRYDWECEITPHYLRHNYATFLYDSGLDPLVAMRILGHADYVTTVKIHTFE